jgi:hypothetical protein
MTGEIIPPQILGTFNKPFSAQVAAFRIRLGNLVPTAVWTDLIHAQHDRAFVVAGAMKADLLADLGAAVQKAIEKGTSLGEFRKDFRRIVEERGWHGWTGEGTKRGEAWRTRVIYKTNMATSYASGRMAQLVAGNYPFWVYRHGGSLEPRIQHLGWDGLILPPDHPFWATHAPPNGWGCSCYVLGARSERAALRLGGKPDLALPDNWAAPDPRTGVPAGIDKGWAYAPGRSVAQEVAIAARAIARVPAAIGSDLGASMADRIDAHWPGWVTDTVAGTSHEPALVGVIGRDVIEALARRGVTPVSSEMMIKPGLLVGPKARRHADAGNALTPEQWQDLPQRIRAPVAVLLDKKSGALIYILPGDATVPQLALRVDYLARRKPGEKDVMLNMIVSAFNVRRADLLGRIAGGLIALLTGGLG